MVLRQDIEEREYQIYSEFAAKAKESRGRDFDEEPCATRTCFQRDRDRIIHSKAFRRLMHKTQVFLAPEGDHYRTRLTHTLEVSQIARTIARGLGLNEDLTEAIALGHDLGHTPFGHNGERVLEQIHEGGFQHNVQSLRVVEYLEECHGRRGMNLTFEVRDGILNHTGDGVPVTLEGQIVKTADRIAYVNHDIDDALRSGVITLDMIPNDCLNFLGDTHSKRIDTMVRDMIKESDGKDHICQSEKVAGMLTKLRSFMFDNVYFNERVKRASDMENVENIISSLYNYFNEKPEELPTDMYAMIGEFSKEEMVKDFIAGMTDRYASNIYHQIFMPKGW